MRGRILDAAVDLTCTLGWDGLTMSAIARRAGVSRQTVYTTVGSKAALAEAMVIRHADRFLVGIKATLDRQREDPVEGLASAAAYTLKSAADDPLLRAVLAPEQAGSRNLVPLLATRPELVLERVIAPVLAHIRELYAGTGIDLSQIDVLVEVAVRLTLSHLLQPTGPRERAVEQVRWLAAKALAR